MNIDSLETETLEVSSEQTQPADSCLASIQVARSNAFHLTSAKETVGLHTQQSDPKIAPILGECLLEVQNIAGCVWSSTRSTKHSSIQKDDVWGIDCGIEFGFPGTGVADFGVVLQERNSGRSTTSIEDSIDKIVNYQLFLKTNQYEQRYI